MHSLAQLIARNFPGVKLRLVAPPQLGLPQYVKDAISESSASICEHEDLDPVVSKGAEVHVVPWDTPFSEQLDNYDGLFLSNGPGDPTKCDKTIEELRKVRLIFLK